MVAQSLTTLGERATSLKLIRWLGNTPSYAATNAEKELAGAIGGTPQAMIKQK